MANVNMPVNITALQASLNYEFRDTRQMFEALRTAGAGYNNLTVSNVMDGNKRLAQLGSALLKMIVLED